MNIFQCAVPKSGNFWLYKIIQQILLKSGRNTKSFIEQQPIYELAKHWDLNFPEQARIDVLDITDLQYSYRISSIFKMPISDISAYVEKSPHIWSHSPICKRSSEIFKLVDYKVYIIRDPRDMVISASKYFCSDYMLKYFPQEITDHRQFLEKNFDELISQWVWHVFDFLRYSGKYKVHICFFEEFLQNFQQELNFLLNYLNIDLNQEQRIKLEEEVSFEQLKQKNPKHLNKGKSGNWINQLSESQKESAQIIAGPLLDYLGYTSSGLKTGTTRNYIQSDLDEVKVKLLQSQKQLKSSNHQTPN